MNAIEKVLLTIGLAIVCLISQAQSTAATYTPVIFSNTYAYFYYYPSSLAIDSKGNVWIANAGSNPPYLTSSITKIPALDPTHPVVFNDPKYQFAWPQAIAIDSKDNVWVLDLGNMDANNNIITPPLVIQIPGGSSTKTPLIYKGAAYQFNGPQGLKIDSKDNVWVTNAWGNTVTKIPVTNRNSPVIFSDSKYGFNFPLGITTDSNGNVWVANRQGSITKIPRGSPGATPIILGTPNTCDLVCAPGRLTVDAKNNVWVPGFDRLTYIPANHDPRNPAAAPTVIYRGPAYNSDSATLDPTTGNIWTSFYGSNSVTEIPIPSTSHPNASPYQPIVYADTSTTAPAYYAFNYPRGIAVDKAGNVWVANFNNDTITKLKKN